MGTLKVFKSFHLIQLHWNTSHLQSVWRLSLWWCCEWWTIYFTQVPNKLHACLSKCVYVWGNGLKQAGNSKKPRKSLFPSLLAWPWYIAKYKWLAEQSSECAVFAPGSGCFVVLLSCISATGGHFTWKTLHSLSQLGALARTDSRALLPCGHMSCHLGKRGLQQWCLHSLSNKLISAPAAALLCAWTGADLSQTCSEKFWPVVTDCAWKDHFLSRFPDYCLHVIHSLDLPKSSAPRGLINTRLNYACFHFTLFVGITKISWFLRYSTFSILVPSFSYFFLGGV